ncbi:DMSO/TMAO reductase YedYZ molybdopterin-dependent catalytic subunit [Microbacterium sp. W4I20]|nr:DMSO/TMAO reductase YedYZ molybdopterin-dependent catalytic subunit [Microbacterium sp. W4I20]
MAKRRSGKRFIALSALAGVIGGAVFLATAEVFALIFARAASPILAVGGFVIDIVPQPVKEFAIATFGEYDKIVLLGSLGLAVVIASAIAGILQLVKPPLGVIALVIAGALSTAAIVTRAGVTALAFLPPLLGTIAGSFVLFLLVKRLRTWRAAALPERAADATNDAPEGDAPENPAAPIGVDRRRFFVLAAISGASAVVVGVASRAVSMTVGSVESIRDALKLPAAKSKVTVPDGAELDIKGLSKLFTPNKDFYRVDTALTVPAVDPETWRLVIDGMVDQRVEMSFQDLLDMGLDEYAITLTCVSNEVGGELVGNAMWLGVPLRDVLKKAGVKSGADMVLSRSVDGYTASTPLAALTDDNLDAILAVAMNGEPLPAEHGFPVRMVVPGLYGYVSATKWLTELKVTTFADDEAYWTPRGYSAEAPIKFSSRLDTPQHRRGRARRQDPDRGCGLGPVGRHRTRRGEDRRGRVDPGDPVEADQRRHLGAVVHGVGRHSRHALRRGPRRQQERRPADRGARGHRPERLVGLAAFADPRHLRPVRRRVRRRTPTPRVDP